MAVDLMKERREMSRVDFIVLVSLAHRGSGERLREPIAPGVQGSSGASPHRKGFIRLLVVIPIRVVQRGSKGASRFGAS